MNPTMRSSLFKKWPILSSLSAFFLFGVFTAAQTTPTPSPSQSSSNKGATQDNDITRRELANFDSFLDGHPEIAEQVRKDPSLLDNKGFLKDHPDLQRYLSNHPGVREEVKENPTLFLHAENRYEHAEDATAREATREKLASFDKFLDSHREIAEQVRRNPSLLDSQQYLKDHPELQAYLQTHPGVREEIQENPNAFVSMENRYDQREDADDRDTTRGQLASFDKFLDRHTDIAEQVRKNPSLLDSQQYLKDHPELQTYLQTHPGVREEIQENPNAFVSMENRYDQREDAGDRDTTRRQLASFDQFLDNHREVAEQLHRNPSLLDSQQFLKDHPELRAYLQTHPGVREEIQENPNAFMSMENRYDQREDPGDRDTTRRQLASFDQFLDNHREIAEQLHRNPALLDSQQFLKDHSELQAYLQTHPGVREEIQENPNAFMSMENRYDRTEAAGHGDADMGHRQFGEFLGRHSEMARDASLVKRDEYMHSHPELEAYLNQHSEVREQLMADPEGFCRSSRQFTSSKPAATNPAGNGSTAPVGQQKPKP